MIEGWNLLRNSEKLKSCDMEQKAFEMALAFQRGEEKGLNFFYDTHYRELVYWGYKICRGDWDLAKDFVQNAFIKAWKAHDIFSHPSVIKSWLYKTVKNEALNFMEREKRLDIWEKSATAIYDDYEEPIEHKIIRKETISMLFNLIKKLPDECRKILELKYIKNISNREIADELGLAISTVKNQKAVGVEKIKDMLKKSAKAKVVRHCPIRYIDKSNIPKGLLKKIPLLTLLKNGDKSAWDNLKKKNYERFYNALSRTNFSHEQKELIIDEGLDLAKPSIMNFQDAYKLVSHIASKIKSNGLAKMAAAAHNMTLPERIEYCKVVFDLKESGLSLRQVSEKLGLVFPTTAKMYYDYISYASTI